MIKVTDSSKLKNGADFVCNSCGRDHTEDNYTEGVDFVFETEDGEEWCICIECKVKWDSKQA